MSRSTDVGAMIADVRRRHGLTQAQLALRAGTSQAAISRIERGSESPAVERLAGLLEVMGERLDLAPRPMTPWADPGDLATERRMTPEERLEQGIQLSEYATELASAAAAQDPHGHGR